LLISIECEWHVKDTGSVSPI